MMLFDLDIHVISSKVYNVFDPMLVGSSIRILDKLLTYYMLYNDIHARGLINICHPSKNSNTEHEEKRRQHRR